MNCYTTTVPLYHAGTLEEDHLVVDFLINDLPEDAFTSLDIEYPMSDEDNREILPYNLIRAIEEQFLTPAKAFSDEESSLIDNITELESSVSTPTYRTNNVSPVYSPKTDRYKIMRNLTEVLSSNEPQDKSSSMSLEIRGSKLHRRKACHPTFAVDDFYLQPQLFKPKTASTAKQRKRFSNREAAHRYRQKQKLRESLQMQQLNESLSAMKRSAKACEEASTSFNALQKFVMDFINSKSA